MSNPILSTAILLTALTFSAAYNFQSGSNGLVMWAYNCDFNGHDIAKEATAGDNCGGICASNTQCTHFTYSEGFCFMKKAANPPPTDLKGAICGWVQNRPSNHIQHSIRTGKVPVRGINLGGWLVVEHWINPKDPLWDGQNFSVCKISYHKKKR